MKIVIDCIVPVAAARIDGVCRRVIDVVVRRHEIVLSESVVAEYGTVAEQPRHATCRDSLSAAIRHLDRVAILVESANVTFGLSNEDDEVYGKSAALAQGPRPNSRTGHLRK